MASKKHTKLTTLLIKLVIKIGIVILIGLAISFALHYINGYALGSTMRVVGIAFGVIGLLSILGGTNMRKDYNYTMAKISNPKMLEIDQSNSPILGALLFLLWMGTAGIVLYLIGDMLVNT